MDLYSCSLTDRVTDGFAILTLIVTLETLTLITAVLEHGSKSVTLATLPNYQHSLELAVVLFARKVKEVKKINNLWIFAYTAMIYLPWWSQMARYVLPRQLSALAMANVRYEEKQAKTHMCHFNIGNNGC